MTKNCADQLLSSPTPGPTNPLTTHQTVSTENFDYQLVNGKIYTRPRSADDPKELICGDLFSVKDRPHALEWKLFDSVGIPFNKKMKSLLSADESIDEISVASEILVAVSNLNKVYMYKPTEPTRPTCWQNILGAPDIIAADYLYLPENRRDWAFSCSVCTKPEVRTTEFMHPHEIVSYFSDDNGINFDFGFTPTIFVLCKEGLKIVYWDTGLPPSFSRGFLVPEGMQGVSIRAAGSTVFLSAIDSQGKLHYFSRMIDYEINGACPGLKISYLDIPAVAPPGNSFFLGSGVRKMPLTGWVEHSVEPLLGNITDKIDIRLTGQGNNARELRIQGLDPLLGWGYYFKNIASNNWAFRPAPAAAPADGQFLKTAFTYNNAFPASLKASYARKLTTQQKLGRRSNITVEIHRFHTFLTDSEPFHIVLHHPNEPSQYICVHAVDAWGLHYHNKYDEDLIGTVDGEPKALVATLRATKKQLKLADNSESNIGAYIKKHFLEAHGKTKSITIIGDNSVVIVNLNHKKFEFKRTISEKEKAYSFYVRKAMDAQLCASPNNIIECTELLEKNKQCLNNIQSIYKDRRFEDGKYTLLNINAGVARTIASGIFKVLPPFQDPTYSQAAEDLHMLLKVHKKATAYSMLGKSKAVGYEHAIALLKDRIALLQNMEQEFIYQHQTAVC